MQVLSIGREGVAPSDSCSLEMCGKHLFYLIELDGGRIALSVSLLDSPQQPERLLSINDEYEGWRILLAITRALEEEDVRSLARPIELGGGTGKQGWVIS